MDKYIQKLNFDFLTNQRVIQLIASIDEYRGKWNIVEKRENRYLKELRRIATIESIGSSTRIEGATMTDEEIQKLLKDVKITKFKTRDEQEVIGYYEVLELVFDNYSEIKLSESYLKQLHQLLLKHSDKDQRHRGSYKNLSNKVVATYPTGEQKTIFDTTEPALVEGEMFELIEWTNFQWETKTIHPLIVLAVFIYEFLSIHPFQDGNGRLSRLLTTLFLLKQGYEFLQYISFENHIEKHKKAYYDALMTAQRKRITQDDIIDKWLLFFLESLKTLTEKLDKKYDVFKQKGGYLNERQKVLKEFIVKQRTIKISDLTVAFPDISPNTLKKDLQYLRDEQAVTTVGEGKGTVYVVKQ
jgi:Fic family protein